MIEFQGWVKVREAYNEEYESEEKLSKIVDQIFEKQKEYKKDSCNFVVDLHSLNGEFTLFLAGASNHKSSCWVQVLELIEWLSHNAVGSYGAIHMYDDEDDNGHKNNFQIYVLKKGKIFHGVDKNLSPLVPEIEEN